MGVGAVFVSTLALSKLPEPKNPPETQAELLATVIQPIVAFVVLGSIVVRMSVSVKYILLFDAVPPSRWSVDPVLLCGTENDSYDVCCDLASARMADGD
jgi:hypothetical protein